jgi:hypothetical protein
MIPQATPMYATVWHPGRGSEPDKIDDSPYLVIGWTEDGRGLPANPVIVKLGGHNGRPEVWAYPIGDLDPTLDYADDLNDALTTISRYLPDNRV